MSGELQPAADLPAAAAAKINNAILYLRSHHPALVEKVREALLVRIADYMRHHGATVGDVSVSFRRLVSPEVAGTLRFPDDLLAEFAKGVALAQAERGRRAALEEQERRRAEDERWAAWRDTPEGQADLKRVRGLLESIGIPINNREVRCGNDQAQDQSQAEGRQDVAGHQEEEPGGGGPEEAQAAG